jgi:hypothetical protein
MKRSAAVPGTVFALAGFKGVSYFFQMVEAARYHTCVVVLGQTPMTGESASPVVGCSQVWTAEVLDSIPQSAETVGVFPPVLESDSFLTRRRDHRGIVVKPVLPAPMRERVVAELSARELALYGPGSLTWDDLLRLLDCGWSPANWAGTREFLSRMHLTEILLGVNPKFADAKSLQKNFCSIIVICSQRVVRDEKAQLDEVMRSLVRLVYDQFKRDYYYSGGLSIECWLPGHAALELSLTLSSPAEYAKLVKLACDDWQSDFCLDLIITQSAALPKLYRPGNFSVEGHDDWLQRVDFCSALKQVPPQYEFRREWMRF